MTQSRRGPTLFFFLLFAGHALADASPSAGLTVRDIAIGQNQRAHVEADGGRLLMIEIRDKTCAAHVPRRYLDLRASVNVDSVALQNRGDKDGNYQSLSIDLTFGTGANAVPGRVEWSSRDCRFFQRTIYQTVGGVDTVIFRD